MFLRKSLLRLALLVGALTPAVAQIPRTISFQGVLADASGALIPDGPQDLTISIYDVSTGGTPLFSETQRVTVVRGVFNAIIGATDPAGIPAAIAFDQQYYLGVRVGSGTELAPRTPFTSVPYALNAAMAQRAIVADTAMWAQSAMTADTTANIRGGHVVSVNGQQGAIELLGQGATTVTRSGNQFIIRSTDTSSGGIRRIDNFDGSLVIDPPQGPFVTMFIREGGIQTHHLRDMSITSSKLAIGAVGTNQIADGAITNPKLAPNAVTSDKITDGTIVTADLADNSVTSPKIVDGQVLTQDISDLQITNVKLAADAVTTDKIIDGGVLNADIGANEVDLSKLTTGGAPSGNVIISDGTTTPIWGNPIEMNLPFADTINSAATLWSLTNSGTGGAASYATIDPASTATTLTVDNFGVGGAAAFYGNGSGAVVNGVVNVRSDSADVGLSVINNGQSPAGFGLGALVVTGSPIAFGVVTNTALTTVSDSGTALHAIGLNSGAAYFGSGVLNGLTTDDVVTAANFRDTGRALSVSQNAAANPDAAAEIDNGGTGSALAITNGNVLSTADALSVVSASSGGVIRALNATTGDSAVLGNPNAQGNFIDAAAVYGRSTGTGVAGDGDVIGVIGYNPINGAEGGLGASFPGVDAGIYSFAGFATFAAQFFGDVDVVGNLNVTGNVSKGGGSFKIDHPLDPENKFLYHSFVESPDMMNIYNGVVELDDNGEATVTMPEWFEALNRDFRYQLTCIGGHAPVFIAGEVEGNTFRIGGGTPGLKVSWQVTGVRHDPYANANRIPVEEMKSEKERGTYLYPSVYSDAKAPSASRTTNRTPVLSSPARSTNTDVSPAAGSSSVIELRRQSDGSYKLETSAATPRSLRTSGTR
jgi:hypothetical protein